MLFLSAFILVFSFWLLTSSVQAQCPVCIVTVGGGMLLAQKLGIDDFLASLWLSALSTAIAYWLATKAKIKIFQNPYLLSFLMYLTILLYFQITDQIGAPSNTLLGIDKLIFGTTVGLLTMFFANWFYPYIKSKNSNKTPFPYAKVAIPLASLLLVTLFFKLAFNL